MSRCAMGARPVQGRRISTDDNTSPTHSPNHPSRPSATPFSKRYSDMMIPAVAPQMK